MNIQDLINVIMFSTVFAPVCIFIHVALTWEGMFAVEVGNFLEKILPVWIAKPLFTCPICMASIWGTFFWFIIGGSLSGWWVIACMSLSGINAIASALLYRDYDDEVE